MRNPRTPHRFSAVGEFFRDVIALIRVIILPRRVAPVPVRRRSAYGTTRWTPPSRLTAWLPLLVGFVLLAAIPAWAGQPELPTGVPNIYDPEVRAHFGPVGTVNLRGNPDFPVLLLMNTTGEQPQALLLGLDARNGKATWSLTTDPIILIVVFSDETTIQAVYVDAGFAELGKASGNYAVVDEVNSPALPDLLRAVTAPETRTFI